MKVKFLPSGQELEIKPDQSVMELAHQNGIFIKSICNGTPNCAECRVRIVDGESNVLPPGAKELSLIGTGYFIDQRRLSCQLTCFGDLTVDLAEQVEKEKSSRKKPIGLKGAEKVDMTKAVTGVLSETDKVFSSEMTPPSERYTIKNKIQVGSDAKGQVGDNASAKDKGPNSGNRKK